MVNLMEFRSVNIGSRLFPGPVVHRSVMVINIMVSRYHQDLYACVLDPLDVYKRQVPYRALLLIWVGKRYILQLPDGLQP